MKKLLATVLAFVLMLGLTACGGGGGSDDGEISVFYYTYSDTYISSVRSAMDKLLKDAGLKYQNYDANGNQTTQTEQVQTAIAKGSSMLIVNVVDTGSGPGYCQQIFGQFHVVHVGAAQNDAVGFLHVVGQGEILRPKSGALLGNLV